MILLDTHALIWFDRGDQRLGPTTRGLIEEGLQAGEIAISAISIWEFGMLVSKGRLRMDLGLNDWRSTLREQGLIEISISADLAERAATLPNLHGDPADRIIVATADRHILNWQGELTRVRASD